MNSLLKLTLTTGTYNSRLLHYFQVFLTWPITFNIVLSTASGLAYLSQECRFKIIHLDLKPQNILLDKIFMAKLSDFGMAMLMNRKEIRMVNRMRGTLGYLAQSGFWNDQSLRRAIFIMVLEIIAGQKNYSNGLNPISVTSLIGPSPWLLLEKSQR